MAVAVGTLIRVFGLVRRMTRDEDGLFCESADHDEYGVVSLGQWEFDDVVDGDGRPRSLAYW